VLDLEVGRLDEGLEPEQTQLVQFHSLFPHSHWGMPQYERTAGLAENESGGVPSRAGE
jgi:hypothetical protein